jgi:hypothetical protein
LGGELGDFLRADRVFFRHILKLLERYLRMELGEWPCSTEKKRHILRYFGIEFKGDKRPYFKVVDTRYTIALKPKHEITRQWKKWCSFQETY